MVVLHHTETIFAAESYLLTEPIFWRFHSMLKKNFHEVSSSSPDKRCISCSFLFPNGTSMHSFLFYQKITRRMAFFLFRNKHFLGIYCHLIFDHSSFYDGKKISMCNLLKPVQSFLLIPLYRELQNYITGGTCSGRTYWNKYGLSKYKGSKLKL